MSACLLPTKTCRHLAAGATSHGTPNLQLAVPLPSSQALPSAALGLWSDQWVTTPSFFVLCRSASPGRLSAFEDELFAGGAGGGEGGGEVPLVGAVAVSIREGQRTVGVAFLDTSSR
jgi:hypothetical protein